MSLSNFDVFKIRSSLLLLWLAASCSPDAVPPVAENRGIIAGTSAANNPGVFVVGTDWEGSSVNIAKVWNQGKAVSLTDGTQTANATSVFISGSDIYVAGWENSAVERPFGSTGQAKYWKNGVPVFLEGSPNDPNPMVANSIYVSGTDVYVAGTLGTGPNSYAAYWKNNVVRKLTFTAQEVNATSIYVSDSDVYVAGYVGYPREKLIAKLWKNGNELSLSDSTENASALSVFVSGSDVYVAGYVGTTNSIATYWKNGKAINLTDGSKWAQARSIFVSGSDVFVAGFNGQQALYWKNGVAVPLTDGTTGYCFANSIMVSGTDVYVTGNESVNKAKLWKNGVAIDVSNSGNVDATFANSIFVVPQGLMQTIH